MTSIYSTIEIEAEEIEYKRKCHIYLAFLIYYMTLTNYYIVKDTLRCQVIKGQ